MPASNSEKGFTVGSYGILIPEARNNPIYLAQQLEDSRLAAIEQRTGEDPTQYHTEYNAESRRIEITPEERYVGIKTFEIFQRHIKRKTPWEFLRTPAGEPRIQLFLEPKVLARKINASPGAYVQDSNGNWFINIEAMAKEEISDHSARQRGASKTVEDRLSDFMKNATDITRNVHGINRAYDQWGDEEGQHSDALGEILVKTTGINPLALELMYQDNLPDTWEQPFPTLRMMMAYAYIQEAVTADSYQKLREDAQKTGALTVAEVDDLIRADEAFHSGGYLRFLNVFAEVDQNGTAADVLHVASHFQMPAQLIIPEVRNNQRAFLVSSGRLGLNKQMVDTSIRGCVNRLRFMNEEQADYAADQYAIHALKLQEASRRGR